MAIQRIRLVGNLHTRKSNLAKDQFFKNCYPEAVDAENLFIVKRPGLKANISNTAAAGRNLYNWRDNLYSITGNTIRNNTTAADVGTINTTTGPVYYEETGGGSPLLFIQDKTDAWTVTTGDVLTEVTDVDYPGAVVDGVAFLDQFIFVMTSAGVIHNSAVNDPTSWGATDFITAEIRPDKGVAIASLFNYVVAFGEYTIEFFFDDANVSGSPLSRVSEAIAYLGCAAGASVVQTENTLIFLGQDRGGGKRLYGFEGLTPKPLSSKPIERLIEAEGVTIKDAKAFYCRTEGHNFYILTLPTTAKTLVYDLVDQVWHTWSSFNGAVESNFTGTSFSEVLEGFFVQDEDNGKIYTFDEDTFQDAGNIIKVEGVTDLYDGQTTANKFHNRLEVVGDENTTSGNLSISYTDDNYKTYSTPRDVDLSDRAFLTRMGQFQRRAFKYTFEANAPMRLEAFDLDLNLGEWGQ